ncbi:MAG: GerMN domain-containing protein [Spirochaetales bacterium]|nr:GerMN domain-containing protein [Spirochaetales bacterium]
MKKKRSSLGCLFWIALILLVLVVFLFNRKTIEQVMETTGFMDLLQKEKEAEEDETPPSVVIEQPEPQETAPREESPVQIIVPEEEPVEEEPEKEAPPPELPPNMRRSMLYFVKVEEDGTISLKQVVRPVYYRDSPLTETIRALITGLTTSELNSGLLTLIPNGTVLHGVTVRDGIAYMDFSEEFRFNPFGVEGYYAQLRQIIFTATEFPTVTAVQILINGKKHDYLGPEGISLAKPLTRDSFSTP